MNRLIPNIAEKQDLTDLEPAIDRIGRQLAGHSAALTPAFFHRRWWSHTLLDWCMKDETFKVRLFRFIDLLPALKDDRQVTKLIEEYFEDLPTLATPLQWGLRAASATTLGDRPDRSATRRPFCRFNPRLFSSTMVVPYAAGLVHER